MTTDITSLSGITRAQSGASVVSSAPAKVVPINSNVSGQFAQDNKQSNNADVVRAAKQVNDFVKQIGRNLEFSVDESSGRVIITVREPETGKIIRQIPPEELLTIAQLVSENFSSNSIPTGILLADEG